MHYYLAPMEGITGYIFRNAYQKYFHNVDCYYTPFLAPNKHNSFTSREQNDILPAHNQGMRVVPQVLTNQAQHFIHTAKMLEQMGYDEVNLNLGCPSATVVTKQKGAGFLAVPDRLEHFLEDIYGAVPIPISIKTRIGLADAGEFADLLDLFNQFPVKELIVHPRVQKDLYNHTPNWNAFGLAVRESRHPLCYNGDVFTVEDYHSFCAAFPEVTAVMLGRGVLRNPGLIGEIKGDGPVSRKTLKLFHDEILSGYQQAFSGDRPVLFKMQELWFYLLPLLDPARSCEKKIRKASTIGEYQRIVAPLFDPSGIE